MTSKTHQKKMIKKRKKRANKANLKADQRRMTENHDLLHPKAATP
jgi:hypothetical protein